jgi:hypothetical protein
MTHAPAPAGASDFRIGNVVSQTSSVLSRNFLPFFIIVAVAQLPTIVVSEFIIQPATAPEQILQSLPPLGLVLVLAVILGTLSQAMVVYGAFQDMRDHPVSLGETVQVGFSRFFPLLGMSIVAGFAAIFAAILLVFPAFILLAMWFVAAPVCVVEQLGPLKSLGRSQQLTRGHRWPIFGLFVLIIIISVVADSIVSLLLAAIAGKVLVLVWKIIWDGAWGAFYAIAVVVTYHDLRGTKEGVDVHQIATGFGNVPTGSAR